MLHIFGLSKLLIFGNLLERSLEKQLRHFRKALWHAAAFLKGCLIFYADGAKPNAKAVEAGRTPCSVLQVVLNINEGLCIKLHDGWTTLCLWAGSRARNSLRKCINRQKEHKVYGYWRRLCGQLRLT